MVWVLSAVAAVGLILSIFTGPIALVFTLPVMGLLYLVLRRRQEDTTVDQRFQGGPQPRR